jgi:hypothetical protein
MAFREWRLEDDGISRVTAGKRWHFEGAGWNTMAFRERRLEKRWDFRSDGWKTMAFRV